MKRILVGLLGFIVIINPSYGVENIEESSFYSAIHLESVTYQEHASLLPVATKTTVINPVMVSGGSHKLNDRWGFSIEGAGTLYPTRKIENWRCTIADCGSGFLENDIVQANSFTYRISQKRFYGHYTMINRMRLTFGGEYSLHSFKRFPTPETAGHLDALDVIEETKAEAVVLIGIEYDSGNLTESKIRWRTRTLVGMPVWTRAENTEYAGFTFDNATGYNVATNNHFSIAVHKNVHFGLMTEVGYLFRNRILLDFTRSAGLRNGIESVETGRVEYPKHETLILRVGVDASWKF